jgi:hypothetical protein
MSDTVSKFFANGPLTDSDFQTVISLTAVSSRKSLTSSANAVPLTVRQILSLTPTQHRRYTQYVASIGHVPSLLYMLPVSSLRCVCDDARCACQRYASQHMPREPRRCYISEALVQSKAVVVLQPATWNMLCSHARVNYITRALSEDDGVAVAKLLDLGVKFTPEHRYRQYVNRLWRTYVVLATRGVKAHGREFHEHHLESIRTANEMMKMFDYVKYPVFAKEFVDDRLDAFQTADIPRYTDYILAGVSDTQLERDVIDRVRDARVNLAIFLGKVTPTHLALKH